MELSNYELELYRQLQEWEETFFTANTNDFVQTYDYWIEDTFSKLPSELREKIFTNIDQWLFYIQNGIQQSQNLTEKIDLLLSEARVKNNQIYTVTDLKKLPIEQLNHFAQQQISNHQLLSLLQGGMSSTGNNLLLGVDLPLMLVINLRAVQLIGSSYGYDMRHPFEMMTALKVFYCATLPKRFQKQAWINLVNDIRNADQLFFYEEEESMTNSTWLTRPLIQVIKLWAIFMINNKKRKEPSLVSIVIGAGFNYSVTKKVTTLAKHFYQYRLLEEKGSS